MPEHSIRLRLAWDWIPADGPAVRLDLPTTLRHAPAGPGVLARRFRRPRLDPTADRLFLRCDALTGLVALRIDGRRVELPTADPCGPCAIPLDDRGGPSHRLELEFGPIDRPEPIADEPWGLVALVIADRDAPTGPICGATPPVL